MDADAQKLSLTTIKDGAVVEQFDIALRQVIENLADINTTTRPREITLVLKITPNIDRTFLEITAGVKTKLAGQEVVTTTADLKFDAAGRPVALNRKSRQMQIPFAAGATGAETITHFDNEKGAGKATNVTNIRERGNNDQ